MLFNSLYFILIFSLIGLMVVSFTLFIRRLIVNSSGIYKEHKQINDKLDHLIKLLEEKDAEK